MFDHVAIAVSDRPPVRALPPHRALRAGVDPATRRQLVEWEDSDIGRPDREHAVTRRLHVGFRAPTREAVDALAGGDRRLSPRPTARPGRARSTDRDYYGGFLLDPDGNSAEAVHRERSSPVPPAPRRPLWISVADLEASKRFYATIAPHAGSAWATTSPARAVAGGG